MSDEAIRRKALSLLADGEQLDAEVNEIMRGAPYDDLMSLWDRTQVLGDAASASGKAQDLMIYTLATTAIRQEMQRRANVAAGVTNEVEGT